MSHLVRDYAPADEASWLRCRVLSFLATAYFDDVDRAKPHIPEPGLALVAVDPAGTVVGILDVLVERDSATIDTVAVHPDHQRRGIARDLLAEARSRLRALGVVTLDAWTRDDPGTLHWYRVMGFAESAHYLHVFAHAYTDPAEPARAVAEPHPDLRPVGLFLHADLRHERAMRERFARVHVCRRFAMPLVIA
ncbi:GNAT family N-acetyltransferase [Streptomyces sp. NPDC127098]|uniref:GNAT family N-acetyltransferase n=1 Tax=Streptomyces sp. NPDC127098 TaxID=3347137 RepID=UPI00364E8354